MPPKNTLPSVISPSPEAAKNDTLSGTITDIQTDCWFDGICKIQVGSIWVIAENGGEKPPGSPEEIRGSLIGLSFGSDTQQYIGKRVSVFGKEIDPTTWTIYGNKDYYIRIVE